MRLRSPSPALRNKKGLSRHLRQPWAAAGITLLIASSCSLAYDLSPDQCGKTSECARFGASFVCEEGICIDTAPAAGGASGGTAGKGTAGNDTKGGSTGPTSAGEGGADGGADGGTMNSAGDGNTGGTEPMPEGECKTHNDCFKKYKDEQPWACVGAEGSQVCQPLKTEECTELLPFADLNYDALKDTAANAIIVGAFANLTLGTNDTRALQNYDLAFDQIEQFSGGVPTKGASRKVVAVVCNNTFDSQEKLLTPVDHLINDLKVPGILAAFNTKDQKYVFDARAGAADVFMMVPQESDDITVNMDDENLMYHVLAGPDALAVTYQPLIDLVITHLQNQGKLGTGPDFQDARIALVTTINEPFLYDLGNDFEDSVKWNGKDADGNSPGAFLHVGTRSGSGVVRTGEVDAILNFAPHIIVGATYEEMWSDVMKAVESGWALDDARAAQGKPFYILSPFNYGSSLKGSIPDVNQRLLGINWPATLGSEAYDAYKKSYLLVHQNGQFYDSENYYDAAYYLVYGLVAAGPNINGPNIATGMGRLTSIGSPTYNVGVAKLSEAFGYLGSNISRKIDLVGANGRPRWNLGGGRETPASVWCLAQGPSGLVYAPDVLSYDPDSETLTGSVPSTCFTFPAPAPQ